MGCFLKSPWPRRWMRLNSASFEFCCCCMKAPPAAASNFRKFMISKILDHSTSVFHVHHGLFLKLKTEWFDTQKGNFSTWSQLHNRCYCVKTEQSLCCTNCSEKAVIDVKNTCSLLMRCSMPLFHVSPNVIGTMSWRGVGTVSWAPLGSLFLDCVAFCPAPCRVRSSTARRFPCVVIKTTRLLIN